MRRSVVAIIGAALAVVLLAEAGARVFSDALPQPQEWSTPELDVKAERIRALEREGGASVVLFGSSVVDVGVDPALVDPPDGDRRPVYNAALGGGTLAMNLTWAREYVVPRLSPSVVVLGVSAAAFNPNNPRAAETEAEFFDSAPVREMLGTESAIDVAERLGRDASYLVRLRTVLRNPGNFWRDEPAGLTTPLGLYTGFLDAHYRADGPIMRLFAAGALNDYELSSQRIASVGAFIEEMAGMGIETFVIATPITDDFVDLYPDGTTSHSEFVTALATEVVARGGSFTDAGIRDPSEFADPLHVNHVGVARYSELVEGLIDDR